MNVRRDLKTACILGTAAILALYVGSASAQPQPISSPNGSFSGTIDGHTLDLPVRCMEFADVLDISSHDQPIHNSTSIGGVEPAVGIIVLEKGYQMVAFVGGERYKILRATDTVEAFPFTLAREVRASKIGKIEVDFTVSCPAS